MQLAHPSTAGSATGDDLTLDRLRRETGDRWVVTRITGGFKAVIHEPEGALVPRYGRTPGDEPQPMASAPASGGSIALERSAGRRPRWAADRQTNLLDHVMQILDDQDDARNEQDDRYDRQDLEDDTPEHHAGDGKCYDKEGHSRFLTGPGRSGPRYTAPDIASSTGACTMVGITGPWIRIRIR